MALSLSYSEKEIIRLIQNSSDTSINLIWFLKKRLEKNRKEILSGYQKRILKLYICLKKFNEAISGEYTDVPKISKGLGELKETIISIYSDLANDLKKALQEEAGFEADLNNVLELMK